MPKPTGDPDLDCEAELLEQFQKLVERALQAGWADTEVANALLSLAQDFRTSVEDYDTSGDSRRLH